MLQYEQEASSVYHGNGKTSLRLSSPRQKKGRYYAPVVPIINSSGVGKTYLTWFLSRVCPAMLICFRKSDDQKGLNWEAGVPIPDEGMQDLFNYGKSW